MVLVLPAALIERYSLGDEVRVTETPTGLLVQAAKLTMEESFAEMAKEFAENQAELKIWDATLADGLEDEDFSDWPGYPSKPPTQRVDGQ